MSDISLKIVDRGVIAALEALTSASKRRSAEQKGAQAAAKFLKPLVKAAAPKRTGRLRKSVKIGPAERDKPGYVVRVAAPHRHLVIQGTKDRFTKGSHAFRGHMTANPFVAATADKYGDEAVRRAADAIAKALGL